MARIVISPDRIAGDHASLGRDDIHYLRHVLRLSVGDDVAVLDGQGTVYSGRIDILGTGHGTLRLMEKKHVPRDTGPHIILCQGLAKGDKMDFIVQKATELGVSSFHAFTSDRSVPKWDPAHVRTRVRRWEKISQEACRQSGRTRAPEIGGVIGFREALQRGKDCPMKVILWEEEKTVRLRDVLSAPGFSPPLCCLIGPEGGFSQAEVREARNSGYTPVSLGDPVLRLETAALAALSIIQYLAGGLG